MAKFKEGDIVKDSKDGLRGVVGIVYPPDKNGYQFYVVYLNSKSCLFCKEEFLTKIEEE